MLMVFQVLSLNFLHQQVEDCLGKAARILHVPLKKGTWIVPLEGVAVLPPLVLLHPSTTLVNHAAR